MIISQESYLFIIILFFISISWIRYFSKQLLCSQWGSEASTAYRQSRVSNTYRITRWRKHTFFLSIENKFKLFFNDFNKII